MYKKLLMLCVLLSCGCTVTAGVYMESPTLAPDVTTRAKIEFNHNFSEKGKIIP